MKTLCCGRFKLDIYLGGGGSIPPHDYDETHEAVIYMYNHLHSHAFGSGDGVDIENT